MTKLTRLLVAMLAVLALFAAACGDDDDDTASSDDGSAADGGGDDGAEEPSDEGDEEPATDDGGEEPPDDGAEEPSDDGEEEPMDDLGPADRNGDGRVVVGFASAGDANDGGFYQAQVSPAQAYAEEQGWEFLLIDQVRPADAVAELSNLARQDPDIIVSGGGSELVDATTQVSEEFPDIYWALLGGSDEPTEFYANATQDYNEVHYLAGIAMGLVLEEAGGETVGFVSGPELSFNTAAVNALEVGLQTVIPEGEALATYTGDFNDSALALEATVAQIGQGADMMYPFLGAAALAVIEEAQSSDVLIAVQPENRCDSGDFAISVVFSQGAYGRGLLEAFAAGEFEEGTQRVFRIGQDPEQVNVIVCDNDAIQAEVDAIAADIASGAIDPAVETGIADG